MLPVVLIPDRQYRLFLFLRLWDGIGSSGRKSDRAISDTVLLEVRPFRLIFNAVFNNIAHLQRLPVRERPNDVRSAVVMIRLAGPGLSQVVEILAEVGINSRAPIT